MQVGSLLRRDNFDSVRRLRSLGRGRKQVDHASDTAPPTVHLVQHSTAGFLPPELVQHILDYVVCSARSQSSYFVARSALASCALLCRAWYFCAIELLYDDVRLQTTASCKLLVHTLTRRHDFAQRIKSLYLPGADGNMPRDPKELLNSFGNPPQRPRTSLPAEYGQVLQHCRRLHDLHVSLWPTDSPVPILCGLLDKHRVPGIKRIWVDFSQRAGFCTATWGAEGILAVLSHPALATLEACTLSNVNITFGVSVPLRYPKAPMPPVRVLRLRHVSAFEDLDHPVRVLVGSLRTSLESVEIIRSKMITSATAFDAVAGRLRALRITRVILPALDLRGFAALTDLRLPISSASSMEPRDFPPRVARLALDLPVFSCKNQPALGAGVMDWVVHVAPAAMAHLRQVVLHGSVRTRDLCLFWAMAILCASAAEQVGLEVRTHAQIIGGAMFARPSSPLQ